MAKKKVFVSFDWDNDKRYRFLLDAWDANPNFDFLFSVLMPSEVTSDNISRIKAALTARIKSATYTLVIVGKEANTQHKDHVLIGFKNWINYEVNKSAANRNKMVGFKIDNNYASPDELLCAGASWAMSFTQDAITDALNNA